MNFKTNGVGVEKDDTETVKRLTKAAQQGDATAQLNLGMMYGNGDGVEKDDTEAVKWFTKAAQQGNATAQLNLGAMYHNGVGVIQDYITAHLWFNLAAAQGEETARKNRDLLAEQMTKDQIAEAQRLAREWNPCK